MDKLRFVTIIDGSLINPAVDIIEVSQEFLDKELGEEMFDEGVVDSEQEWIDMPDEEKCEHFLFQHCGYSPANCQWQWFGEKPQINRLTPKSFR